MSAALTQDSAPLLVVQMHGEPGSGKTALARTLAPALPAIHLDKDVISSALIRAGIAPELQGPGAYESLREVARSLMQQGHSVILDSPCFWPMNEEKGRALAADFGATWAMIECKCPGEVVEQRLATRERLESHPLRRGEGAGRPGMYEPACGRLVLESTRAVADVVAEAVGYLGGLPLSAKLARPAARPHPPAPLRRERPDRAGEGEQGRQVHLQLSASGLGPRNSELAQ